jgi:hypothetical protein
MKLTLPKEVVIISDPSRIRFQGGAEQILVLSKELEKISFLNDGDYAELKPFKFYVSSVVVHDYNANNFYLPMDAWRIMAAKFREVASSWEDSPFDFNDCGYISPKLERDIGVELIGDPYPR